MPAAKRTRRPKVAPSVPAWLAVWCQGKGVELPIPEYAFHPTRRWRWDWAWRNLKVAVELDGGIWVGGRHSGGKGQERDNEKHNTAQAMGWVVGRFSPAQVKRGDVLAWLDRVFFGFGPPAA